MGWPPAFLKHYSVAQGREEKGDRRGRVRVEAGEGGEGGWHGGRQCGAGRSAVAPDRRVRAASLPRKQGRAVVVGDAATWANMADERDRGEAGPGGSGRGARGKERESDVAAVGRRQAGPDSTVPGGAVQIGFETKSEFNCFKI
jgi:hypothetical protein